MINKDFCVCILTHGRPDKVLTYKTLLKCGYTGEVYFVVDNEDKTVDRYRENFGDERVIVFDKKAMADSTDECNNWDYRKVGVHARNACFDIAKKLGYTYFIQLDDDYTAFKFMIDTKSTENCGDRKSIKNIDKVFDLLLSYYKDNNFLAIAMAQGGDFIGGINNGVGSYRFSKRKCMNSWICSTKRRFKFIGSFNDDVNTYTILGSRGNLFLTIPLVSIDQPATQSGKGGMTEAYKLTGTYIKSFHTILMHPSSVKVAMMRTQNIRLHHSFDWKYTMPMIISDVYKIF